MGGTFDPPHLAHMAVAEAAFQQLELDEVRFIPAGTPWQKSGLDITPARHRWEMAVATTCGIPYLRPDDREVLRPGPTYTVDTLAELEDHSLTLILGSDSAAHLPSWFRAREVQERARIAVAPRPGTPRQAVEQGLGGKAQWIDVPLLDLSGTQLRHRASAGLSLRFLVREPVRRYILAHHLYEQPISHRSRPPSQRTAHYAGRPVPDPKE